MIKDNIARQNAQKMADMLNSFSFNPEIFCKEMATQHRTLQQSFTRLCIQWICTCADDNYQYDGRNEASHEIAKAIVQSQDADFLYSLPLI